MSSSISRCSIPPFFAAASTIDRNASTSSLRALYAEPLFRGHALPKETLAYCRKAHPKIGAAILAGDGESAQTLMAGHMVDLNRIVNRRAAWFLDDRVTWEV